MRTEVNICERISTHHIYRLLSVVWGNVYTFRTIFGV